MSTRFDLFETQLAGLQILQRRPIGDSRGYFERLFCAEELRAFTVGGNVVQINHTATAKRGTVRGMHFQRPPHAEIKFVSCLSGAVLDVAVDLRKNSPTFLCWHAEILSADNHKTVVIPEGFAHGFQTLSDNCQMLYLHTASHRPEAEGGLHALDPRLAIQWPLPVAGLSPRDNEHPMINDYFAGVTI